MKSWLRRILPERIPSRAALFYTQVPAKVLSPHYGVIAQEVLLGKGDVLVDLGTGPGILPILIAKRFPASRIIGIDLSERMIEIANKKGRGVGNAEFRVMDAGALQFGDNSLDMVISTGSLHHWKDPVKVLNEVCRCLKPGAEAWVYDGYGDATDADIEKGIRHVIPGFPPRWLVRRILGLHGFSQIEYDTLIKNVVAKTTFRRCSFERFGIMMRLRFRKWSAAVTATAFCRPPETCPG